MDKEQAHGDALAALVDEIAPPIPPFNNEAEEEEEYHCEAAVRHYSEHVRERLRRHLTASGVPEGYKLVPVEPTEAMCEAGEKAAKQAEETGHTDGFVAPSAYSAMIAAAPQRGGE